mmetsp:Transcript_65805/g.176317  ORF Transcript_65805/g.176317 Transcript_65805/m.176317 type:complete len:177 (-) Transcript_65805:63-593(-)
MGRRHARVHMDKRTHDIQTNPMDPPGRDRPAEGDGSRCSRRLVRPGRSYSRNNTALGPFPHGNSARLQYNNTMDGIFAFKVHSAQMKCEMRSISASGALDDPNLARAGEMSIHRRRAGRVCPHSLFKQQQRLEVWDIYCGYTIGDGAWLSSNVMGEHSSIISPSRGIQSEIGVMPL